MMSCFKKKFQARLALLLCAAIITGVVGMPREQSVAKAATAPEIQAEALNFPTGALQEIEGIEVEDVDIAEIPSYENAVVPYCLFDAEDVFEQGTGDYGYLTLSDAQKELYDGIAGSLKIFLASEDAQWYTQTVDSKVYYTPFRVRYSIPGVMSKEELLAVLRPAWMAFLADHPWLFWLNSYLYSSSAVTGGGYTGEFMPVVETSYIEDPDAVKEVNQMIEAGVQTYLEEVEGISDTYEKVRRVYDEIIHAINYAYQDDGKTPVSENWAHSVVGVFDSNYSRAVCEGYAKTFSLILNLLDIPNVYIVGMGNSGAHAWNAVSFDGGDTYYYMDATWDDRGGAEEVAIENYYKYFAMSKDAFEQRHKAQTPEGFNGSRVQGPEYELPSMGNDMDYTYYVRYGSYAEKEVVTDTASAAAFLKTARALSPDEENCLMLMPDEDTFGIIRKALGSGTYSYSRITEYEDMYVFGNPAKNFQPAIPAGEITFSETQLSVDLDEVSEQELTIASATSDSDDYITFYSTNEKVALVKTPYVKAEEGQSVRIRIKGAGIASICARAAKGEGQATCEITVASSKTPEPTEAPEPTEKPEGTAEPTGEPTPTEEVIETPEDTAEPTEEPTPIPTATVGVTGTPGVTTEPTKAPTPTPTATAGVTGAPGVTTEPTKAPTPIPTATAGVTGTPGVTTEPTKAPTPIPTAAVGVTGTPGVTAEPTKAPTPTPTATAGVTGTPGVTTEPAKEPTPTPTATAGVTGTPGVTTEPTKATTPTATVEVTRTPVVTEEPMDSSEPTVQPGQIITLDNTQQVSQVQISGDGETVAVKQGADKKSISLDSVVVNGEKYAVKEISANAYKNKKKLQKVTIGKSVKKIGSNAFAGCKNLKSITFKSATPPKLGKNAFKGINKHATIYVPKKSLKAYKKVLRSTVGYKKTMKIVGK